MHSRPSDSQHPRDLGVGFVQVPADDFEPLTGQGMLPLGVRVGLHRPAVIKRIFCREFKHYSIARFAVKANRQIGFPSPPPDGCPKFTFRFRELWLPTTRKKSRQLASPKQSDGGTPEAGADVMQQT
jgi:hypothetical protein